MIEELKFVIDLPTKDISFDKTFGPVVDFIGGALRGQVISFLFERLFYRLCCCPSGSCGPYVQKPEPEIYDLPERTSMSEISSASRPNSSINYGVSKSDLYEFQNEKTSRRS